MASGTASRRRRAQRAQQAPVPAPKPRTGRAPWVLAAAIAAIGVAVAPYCREFAVDAFPALVEKYVRTGKVRIELRGLAFLGPDSERGLRAGLAAGRHGRMFDLMELLYYNQEAENSGWLSQSLVEAAARSLPGIDVARLVDDMDGDAVSSLLEEHAAEAERHAVQGTPTILVGPTGGELKHVRLTSPGDVMPLERAIGDAL